MTSRTPEQIADTALATEITWPDGKQLFATLDHAVDAGAYTLDHASVRSLLTRTIAAVLSSNTETVEAAKGVHAVIGGDIFIREDGLEALVVADLDMARSYVVSTKNDGGEITTVSAETRDWTTGWEA